MNFISNLTFDWLSILNFEERPFRAKIVPSKIWSDLDGYRNNPSKLPNYCKKWRTKISWIKPSRCNVTRVYVGGEYDIENRQCIIEIHTKDRNKIKFTDRDWRRFKYTFIQTLMHEMIHFKQFDKRNGNYSYYMMPYKASRNTRKNDERQYLSSFDEIQAYAHCVYLDIMNSRSRQPLIKVLQHSRKKKSVSPTLKYILKTFDYDYRNNKAIPKLMQHVLKWDKKYNQLAKYNS